MKKQFYTLLGILVFLFAFSSGVEIKVDVHSAENETGNAQITITVLQGEPEFTYLLCDKEPWDGGQIIEKTKPVLTKTHTFKNIEPGTYFIAVRDKSKSLKGEYISIK